MVAANGSLEYDACSRCNGVLMDDPRFILDDDLSMTDYLVSFVTPTHFPPVTGTGLDLQGGY